MTTPDTTRPTDHPLRYDLASEMHARPFPALSAPSHAFFMAFKVPQDAASRDRQLDRDHFLVLLDRHGAPHPRPGATHWFGTLGRHSLKWECHTEFTTYTLFIDGLEDRPFDPAAYELLPKDWLAEAPGQVISSALIRIDLQDEAPATLSQRLGDWFVTESVAVSQVVDGTALVAGDFRIDSSGHMRFAVFARPDIGARRLGRIVQRLTEIETYKTMALLGLPKARETSNRMGEVDSRLTHLMGDLGGERTAPEQTLDRLLGVSAELENLMAGVAFRFGATGAYEAIVHDRIAVLREEPIEGRQTFGEFMMRRFDPAMRTVRSTEARLRNMSERAERAGDLLRTRVDVERQAQNQRLLESMDRRADMALRLQETVEGLSVVAISYYAVNLAAYATYPFLAAFGLSKGVVTALLTPVVILVVFLMVRRIRRRIH